MEKIANHYFYVLECSDGSYYAGYTNHLEKRLKVHNNGKGAKYTRGRTPVVLIFAQSHTSKGAALRAEYQFKQLTRKQKERFLNKEWNQYNVATEKF